MGRPLLFNGTNMVTAAAAVVVTLNYRLGSFGFLGVWYKDGKAYKQVIAFVFFVLLLAGPLSERGTIARKVEGFHAAICTYCYRLGIRWGMHYNSPHLAATSGGPYFPVAQPLSPTPEPSHRR